MENSDSAARHPGYADTVGVGVKECDADGAVVGPGRFAAAFEVRSVGLEIGLGAFDVVVQVGVLAGRFEHFFWTGFYRVCGDRLVVGPYIGTLGCLQIEFGKGVCGTAAAKRETVIVPDVNQFPGHIACDANSKSEIVVPVFGPDQELIAVLDVDSDRVNAFDEDDREGLEKIVALFSRR